MENEYFLNGGVSPTARFEPEMRSWNSVAVAQEFSYSNPNWDKQFDHFNNFDSSLSKIVSSPMITPPPEYFSGEINNISPCFISPLNSPSMQQCGQFLNQFAKEKTSHLEINSFAADPDFVERAAKFSCFGSRSFNGRRSDLGINDTQLQQGSSAPAIGISKLHRVWSSPTLKLDGSPMANKKPTKLMTVCPKSNKNSSIFEQVFTEIKTPSESNPKKRKSVHRANKPKEEEALVDDPKTEKQSKSIEVNGSENGGSERKFEANNGDDQKPPELSKDYIHVRARRGQATDSHSLAERVRREKIGERMKFLQDLVPGCNKVTGKALMLDEIINYVKSLQGKVEFLSMKLASVNTIDCNFKSKDKIQPHSLYSIDTSIQNFHGQYPMNSVTMDSDTTSYQNIQIQIPSFNGFTEGIPQVHGYCEDNLHNIIQMGLGQNLEKSAVAETAHSSDDPLLFLRRYEL